MMGNIHFPVALEKGTKRLVNAKDVPNGLACNCFCANCNEDLIAANNGTKQAKHFRHKPDSKCSFNSNFESYIHWLAKYAFQFIEEITIPQIKYIHLDYDRSIRNKLIDKLKKHLRDEGISDQFDERHIDFPFIILQSTKTIKINNHATEVTLGNNGNSIRADIVIESGNNKLLIEPFFTNKIDSTKLEKIEKLDLSTISIDLVQFNRTTNSEFTIEEFINYLSNNLNSKSWIYINSIKREQLIGKIFSDSFFSNLKALKAIIDKNSEIEKDLEILDQQRLQIIIQMQNLNSKITKVSIANLFK